MSILVLRSSVAAPGGGSAPAWFTALAHKEIGTPVGNWLGDAAVRDPNYNVQPYAATTGHQAIVIAYTGMGADQTRRMIFLPGNGGHADYAGNEVYACDLGLESPVWTRRRDASGPPVSNDEQVHEEWADGTPPSDHTCNYIIEAEGQWYKVGLGSPNWLGGPAGTKGWQFDPDTDSWIDNGNIWLDDNYGLVGCGVWDQVNRHLIKITPTGNPCVQFIDIDTMTQVKTAGADPASSSVISADIDPVRRMLVWRTGTDYTTLLFVMDLNNTAAGWFTVPMTGTAPGATHRFYWHGPSGAFLSWDTNHGLMKMTPTLSGSTYTGAVWSTVTGLTGATPVMPGTVAGGMWSKVQKIDDMGNGDSAIVLLPRYADPDVYVIRLTGAV